MSAASLLSCRGVTKYFPETDTLANDRIDLSLEEGERRAIVGENGAGKSTLGRIIAGLARPDSGEIALRGRRLEPGSVRAAEEAGIGFVPQVSLLAGELSAAENIALGRESRAAGIFLSRRKAYVEAAMLFERFELRIDPDAPVSSLSAAERREVEIARALARGGDILILDEPTSILSESESERLFELLDRLSGEGKAIVLVTHRLAEVKRFAQRVSVLRSGALVADESVASRGEAELAALMARGTRGASRPAAPLPAAASADAAARSAEPPLLELRGIRLARGAAPLSLAVRPGEVLAVAALAGNGLGRLEDYASGLSRPSRGELLVDGLPLSGPRRRRLRRGQGAPRFAYLPSDRESRGLCLSASIRDNILALRLGEFRALDYLGGHRRDEAAAKAAAGFGLSASPRNSASSLSGGNRQRLALARELGAASSGRAVLVLAEPLQGLDLAAQELVQARVRELAASGAAILLLGSSVEELVAVADRVAALYRGEIAYEGPNEGPATAKALLAAMTGAGGSA